MADEVAYPEDHDDSPKMPQDRAEKVTRFNIIRLEHQKIAIFG